MGRRMNKENKYKLNNEEMEYININGKNIILNKTRRKKSLKEFLEDFR